MTIHQFPARPHPDDGADMMITPDDLAANVRKGWTRLSFGSGDYRADETPWIPIRSAQADAAAAAHLRNEATHDRRRREYEAMFNLSPYARNTVPPEKLTEAEIETILPRRFVCNEVGGRPADDMPALLTRQGVFTAGGVVLILAAGWLGGILSVLAVL